MEELLNFYYENRESYSAPFRLRIHRAISWLKKAESCEDDDTRFIALWIAFNAAYARELEAGFAFSERGTFRQFLHLVCALDKDGRIDKMLWQSFSGSIRLLLDNRYVFQPFWDFHNGKISEVAWQEDFARAKEKAQKALASRSTDNVLLIVFDRLYTLRNQIMHGGATFASKANRQQLKDACAILQTCVPAILHVMQQHHAREDWGQPFYPFVKEN